MERFTGMKLSNFINDENNLPVVDIDENNFPM
jgi:hypothetical protein